MSKISASSHYYICSVCSNSIAAPEDLRDPLDCDRCGHQNHRLKPRSIQMTLIYSMTALIFMIPANLLPFMSIELYGNRNSSTIWSGILSLAEAGSWPIAVIVFFASLVIPLVKLLVLFYLALTARHGQHAKFKTRLYNMVEAIGRWSMLDIFLLAVLVAIMKLGPWTRVEPRMGSMMFALVVIFTMLASASFDPQLLWKAQDGRPEDET